MLPIVTPDDIREAAFGVNIPAGSEIDTQIEGLVAKAGRIIVNQVPNLTARLASGKVTLDDIQDVIEAMVVRLVRNPSGYRQIGIDDFQATIDTTLSAGGLYLSEDERKRLDGPRKSRKIGSARLALPDWRLPNV